MPTYSLVVPAYNEESVIGELVARVSGFGPLQRFLDDPEVEEIWINDPSRVFVARNGKHELTTTILDTTQVQELVERMLKSSGRRVDLSTPFVDATLPARHGPTAAPTSTATASPRRGTSVPTWLVR